MQKLVVAKVRASILYVLAIFLVVTTMNFYQSPSYADSFDSRLTTNQNSIKDNIMDICKINTIVYEGTDTDTDTIFSTSSEVFDNNQHFEIAKATYKKIIQDYIQQQVTSTFSPSHYVGNYEYRTVMHESKAKFTYKDEFASGQLQGGYKGNAYLYYNTANGNNYTLGVSFGSPYGSVSFSGSTGTKSGSGMMLKLPNNKDYFKIKAKKGYKSTPYTVQHKKKGSSTWENVSYGIVAGIYYSVDARCVRV